MALDIPNSEDDWQLLPNDWWRISYTSVDWREDKLSKFPSFFIRGLDSSFDEAQDDDLNPDLVGVRVVEDVLGLYESLVGFYADDDERKTDTARMVVELSDEQLAVHKERWDQLMFDLMDGDPNPEESSSTSSSSHFGLSSSISTLDSLDLARPSTPKAKPSYTTSPREIRSCNPSPAGQPSSPQPITFPSLYPSFSDFTFPSLTAPPVPKLKIQKDEQGFYSVEEIKPPVVSRPSATLLPPFLHDPSQRRKAPSKTRSIVDRLRKAEVSPVRETVSHSPSPSPPFSADSSYFPPRLSVSEDGGDREAGISIHSLEEDGDGWIGLTKQEVLSTSKARRTRDLFRALKRHRSDSSSPLDSGKHPHPDDSPDRQSSLSSSSTSSSPSNDGWIEGVVTCPKVKPRKRQQSQSRSKKKTHQSTPSFSQFPTALPASYPAFNTFYAPTPQPYFYAPYSIVPMQSPYVAAYPVAYPHPTMHGTHHHVRQASSLSRPPVR